MSDLKITATPTEAAPKVSSGACDLYLVCDSLVGTDPANPKAASPDRTVAVLSTTAVPTGRMVVDTGIEFPAPGAIRGALDSAVARTVSLDADHLATELFASEQYAHMILMGAAFPLGRLPVSEAALEQTVTLNDASVATNLQAFRRGRQAVADPDVLQQAIHGTVSDAPTDLATLITRRTKEPQSYQDAAYAQEYTEFVAKTRTSSWPTRTSTKSHDSSSTRPSTQRYVTSSARTPPTRSGSTHRCSARWDSRKDRTRPSLATAVPAAARHEAPTRHPPRHVRLPPSASPGTPTHHRVPARDRTTTPHLTPHTAATATKLAALPDMIRGYEQITIANVRDYRAELARLRDELTTYHPATT